MKCVSGQRQREKAIENSSAMLLCFMTECLKFEKKNRNCGARYITVMVRSLARCDMKYTYLEQDYG